MTLKGKAKFIKYTKRLIDVLLSWILISMMLLWGTKYLFPLSPLLARFEVWVGSDQPMHLTLGFFVPLCVGWLARLYRCHWRVQSALFGAIAIAFAVDELCQAWVPYRSATWVDFQMSMIGWGLAMLVWFYLWQLLFQPTRAVLANHNSSD